MRPIQRNAVQLRYRPDIDGLRALAIVAVVLYHARIGDFSGGFVGVDVFFVISGYLIASLIDVPIREKRFSFVDFYERRIRRIFPMLAVVLTATALVSLFVLFPADLERFSSSLASAALFLSNFDFYGEAGYFDVAAAQKPLLHTWSLGVEAQFYLILPPILFALRTCSRARLVAIVGAIALASLAVSQWAVGTAPAFAFYLLPSRLWELLVGVMLAVARLRAPPSALAANGFAVVGLLMIAWAIFVVSPATPFPGAIAIAPCLGAALVIYAGSGEGSSVNRALGSGPVVFVGLISYSLYLWHWPVLSLARYFLFRDLTTAETWAAILVSFGLSTFSWFAIEQPALRRRWLPTRARLMRASAAAAAVLVSAGGAVSYARGLPERFPPRIQHLLAVSTERPVGLASCFAPPLDAIRAGDLCRIGDDSAAAPTFLLWGDSHAEAMAPAVAEAAERHHRLGLYAARGSCPPLIGVDSSRGTACRAFAEAVVDLAIRQKIDEVVLIAFWANYSEGSTYAPGSGDLYLTDGDNRFGDLAHDRPVFAAGLDRTIAKLTAEHIKVVLVGPVPEIYWPVPESLARLAVRGEEMDLRTTRATHLDRQSFVLKSLKAMRDKYGVALLRPDKFFCASEECEILIDGNPLYRDAHHLSEFGAEEIVPILELAFE